MTAANLLVPAAQYLRMSTEHQQYSLENQCAAIRVYAESHGFDVVSTYSHASKRGVVIKNRTALLQLLAHVVAGTAPYRAVLVYDVSRWGRFQDTDESAHYEFLCKMAGVPVHYCAETFANDGTLPSLIMKALKRTMAGEFSRELGVKVLAGQKRLARLGFKQGGVPGFGLRRMLIAADGTAKQELAAGERKSIATDRVVLVPGPAEEVRVVKDIYRMLVSGKMSVSAIARALNGWGIGYVGGSRWDYQKVYAVLSGLKYTGCHAFGRTSCKLSTRSVRLPRSEWVLAPGAFQPIVDGGTFSEAQRILQGRTFNRSDQDLLEKLRALLASEGRLSLRVVKNSDEVPSPSTYRHRFGSLRRAYELIGYGHPDQFGPVDLRRRTQALREGLVEQIAAISPGNVSIVRRGGRWRSRMRLRSGLMVSVLIGRCVRVWKQTRRWVIDPNRHECRLVTLVARLDEENKCFLDFHVFRRLDCRRRIFISLHDPWLDSGQPVPDLRSFCDVVRSLGDSNHGNLLSGVCSPKGEAGRRKGEIR
jgi:DNA invertase Pin-like site-specific DNA recombinase